MRNAMLIDPRDNVAVAIESIQKGDTVTYVSAGKERGLTALEDITIYHKVAVCDIPKGQPIIKYGEHIGEAGNEIRIGEHVHIHNVRSRREDLEARG